MPVDALQAQREALTIASDLMAMFLDGGLTDVPAFGTVYMVRNKVKRPVHFLQVGNVRIETYVVEATEADHASVGREAIVAPPAESDL